jgi:hypothetical protein
MKTVQLLLAAVSGAFCWTYNGGGNMTTFEKADAVYRKTSTLGIDDYHAGMVGKFFINSSGKPTLSFGQMHVDKFVSWSGTIDGVAVNLLPTGTADEGANDNYTGVAGLGGDFRVRKMELSIDPAALHTKATTDVLGKALRLKWGWDDGSSGSGSSNGSGSSGSGENIFRGAFQSNTGLATATVRDNILNEGFINIARAAHTVNYGWTGPDLVDYVFYWVRRYFVVPVPYTYFRNLYDAEDARCDFLTEWSNDKSGVPVWGTHNSLKWINGGSTDNADYHNDFVNSNDSYLLDEYSALIESGDFIGNGRKAQQRTTFRPSVAAPPIIRNFAETSGGPKLEIEENLSTNVYYSIELFNASGAFVAYAKDADGAEYKYRQLYLSQDLGASRYQIFYPTTHSSQTWSAYTVKVIVTDEGANTSEKTYNFLPGPVVPPTPAITQLKFSEIYTQTGCFPGFLQKIYGTNFDPVLARNLIIMNGATVMPNNAGTDVDGNWLSFYAPSSVRSGDLKVSVDGRVSNAVYQKTYPIITDVSGKEARIGDLVTLTGIGFDPASNHVSIHGPAVNTAATPALIENTATRVSFLVPEGAVSSISLWFNHNGQPIFVSVPDFIVKPAISSATQYPTRNGWIRINGTGYTVQSKAVLGGVTLATTFIDDHTLQARVPADFPLGIEALRIHTRQDDASDNCGPLVMESNSLEYNVKISPNLAPILSLLLQ